MSNLYKCISRLTVHNDNSFQTSCSSCDKAPHLADVLIEILGTKVDIGPSQIGTLVAMAAIFQNGRQRLEKTINHCHVQ